MGINLGECISSIPYSKLYVSVTNGKWLYIPYTPFHSSEGYKQWSLSWFKSTVLVVSLACIALLPWEPLVGFTVSVKLACCVMAETPGRDRKVFYRYYWARVTPRHVSPRLTRWRKQCLESRSEKATRTRYQVRVTFSDWLSEHYIIGIEPLVCVWVAPDKQWLEPSVWCNPDPNRGLYSLNIKQDSQVKTNVSHMSSGEALIVQSHHESEFSTLKVFLSPWCKIRRAASTGYANGYPKDWSIRCHYGCYTIGLTDVK